MDASNSATTPLLVDARGAVGTHNAPLDIPEVLNNETSLPTSLPFPRGRRILAILTLATSSITLILIIPTRMLLWSFEVDWVVSWNLLVYTTILTMLVCLSLPRIEQSPNVLSR